MDKKKIFAFINGKIPVGLAVVALAEDGTLLAQHVSSNKAWAKHDIGVNSEWKHDNYNNHYPDGWELIWIDDMEKELKNNKLLKKAISSHNEEEEDDG